VSPTRAILGVIEHEIPIHDLLHLADLDRGELQIVEAQLDATSPVVGQSLRDLQLPDASYVVAVVRGEHALPARPETRLVNGDRLLAVTSSEHEAELRTLLIGE
jgi:trk system potassium uptake protein TrkA